MIPQLAAGGFNHPKIHRTRKAQFAGCQFSHQIFLSLVFDLQDNGYAGK